MKKTLLTLTVLFGALATINAQDNSAKKTPPTVVKTKAGTAAVKKNNAKRAPVAVVTKTKKQPVQKKAEQPKFTPPVIVRDTASKKG